MNSYSARYYTSQITIENTRSSLSVTVFTNRFFVLAFNDGCFPSSGFSNCPRSQFLTATAHNKSGYLINSPSHWLTQSLTN
jgi:hypothetical protein